MTISSIFLDILFVLCSLKLMTVEMTSSYAGAYKLKADRQVAGDVATIMIRKAVGAGTMREITRRIERETNVADLTRILAEQVRPSDLQSLLLEVSKMRVERRELRDVLTDYSTNVFMRPSLCDPAALLAWDRIAFSHLPDGFDAIELSPVSPFGTVSRMANVSQDWVLTTVRNSEVIADATNVLALECALRRQGLVKRSSTDSTPVKVACSHRVTRTQHFETAPGVRQHFRMFSLCSAGRSTRTLRFEEQTTMEHIRFYLESLTEFLGIDTPFRVSIKVISKDQASNARIAGELEHLRNDFSAVEMGFEPGHGETGYYRTVRFNIYARPRSGVEMQLVDGGDTDWTQKLLNNAKERLVTSGIGSERVCAEFQASRRDTRRS